MPRKYTVFTLVTLLTVVLDQATKWWVRANIELWHGSVDVIPGFFNLVHYQNTGAAFGAMDGVESRMTVFAVFTVIAMVLMVGMVIKLDPKETFVAAMMGLVAGGAVGNAIDRVMYRAVTDFLRFYSDHPGLSSWMRENVGTAEWPSFNIADSAIVVGIIVFFIQQLLQDRGHSEADDEALLADEEIPEMAAVD